MENLVVDAEFWRGKRVLLTGHTGFKGGWLALWLQKMQAEVFGLALAPSGALNFFTLAEVGDGMQSGLGDIADLATVQRSFEQAKPDIVIHMAAQALVRYSYREPVETYRTNVMGTLHVLECLRHCQTAKAAVLVATDKCYENREWPWPYRENDALGGHDPYSSSKACMEILTASYRNSFFTAPTAPAVASVRSGNVIGGGDWAADRLLPDLIRAAVGNQPIAIRHPQAIRPWQHVLEPLSGYLRLAERLYNHGHDYAEAWNFGPSQDAARPVSWIVEQVRRYWPHLQCTLEAEPQPHEASTLKLDCSKARERLGWQGRWPLSAAVAHTLAWYQRQQTGEDMKRFSLQQIDDYLHRDETA